MKIIIIFIFLMFESQECSIDLSFLTRMKRLIGREVENNLKGTFKSVRYLGSVVKIPCFGKKYRIQDLSHYSWYHLGKRIFGNKHYAVDKYGTLDIRGVSVEDSGIFMCEMHSKRGKYKFKHDVTVVQFPSKALHIHFVYTIQVCSQESKEFAKRFIESKLKGKVCSGNDCKLNYIHSSCQLEEFDNPNLRVTVPIELPGVPDESCNAPCLRKKLEHLKEEVKQKVISTVMRGPRLKIREEPTEMSISYLETEDDNICSPGFEMKGTMTKSLCIPCAPGHFLEKGYCIPCHLNHYNGKYAATECITCFGDRVTRSRGADSEEDCYLADPDVLWMLFIIIIVLIPFLLVCGCWNCAKCFAKTFLVGCIDVLRLFTTCNCKILRKGKRFEFNEEKNRELKNPKQGIIKSKGTQLEADGNIPLEQQKTPASSQRQARTSGSTFVIPSVRHSSGRDFFYKQPPKSIARKVIPPLPPALPTDSMLKEAARNIAHQTAVNVDKPESRNTNKSGFQTLRNNTPRSNTADISSVRGDVLPHYSERILKNPPMYNAFMKSKV